MTAQVAFTGLSVVLMEKAGRRSLLALSSGGMVVSALALAFFFSNGKRPAWLALVALVGYVASFSVGMGPVPWLMMGEIFPASIRSPACGLAALVNWCVQVELGQSTH